MPRTATRPERGSDDFKMGQPDAITDKTPRDKVSAFDWKGHRFNGVPVKKDAESGILLLGDVEITPEYLAELAFNEEPVTIKILPSTQKNAATVLELWCNGIGAEVLVNGRWMAITHLPVDQVITVKRKIVEQIVRARVMNVSTQHDSAMVENPRNEIIRQNTPVHSFQIIKDDNPRSVDWLTMIMARPV